jgi:HEAT repeat protein
MSEDLNFWASFIPGYATEFAAGLTLAVLEAVARRVCRAIQGTPAERALQNAYEEGFKACLATMSPPERHLAERYAGLFRRFVQREKVADVFAELVDVRPDVMLNLPELETEFADVGYDIENYPGIDFPVAMRAFAVAYTDAVDRSEELHYIVEVRYLRQMVNRLTELVGPVREMATYTATLPDMAADLEQLVNLGQQLVTGQADQADLMRVIARVQVHRHEGQLDRIILLMQGLNSLLRDAEMARADVAELRVEVQLLRQEIDHRTERGLSPDELNQLETLYRRQMIEAHRLLTFQGMLQHNQPVALPLTDVFVSLWLTSAAPKGATPEEERLRRRLEAEGRYVAEQRMTERQREELMRRLEEIERERWERTGERLEAAKAMAEADNQAMVLLGDPGAGKTTLMRYLALTFAEDRAVERLSLDERRLPILVPLAAYDAALKRDEDLPLSAFLARYYETDRELPGLAPLLRQALDEGRAIVLFDGLDEVLEASTRRLIAQRVQAFIDRYLSLGNRVILTSRIVGYQEARLPGEIPHFTVLSLSEKDIATFLHSWSLAFEARMRGESLPEVSGETVRAAQKRERGLHEAVEAPSVRRLANNPLLLTILAVVYTQEGLRLPRRRVELYDRYSRILIETWNRVRSQAGRPVGKPLEFLTTAKILSSLALWLQQERPSGMARGMDVRRQLRNIFLTRRGYAVPDGDGRVKGSKRPFPPPTVIEGAEREAETFLQDVREHSGLVVERGRDTYGFMHLTFQEYFAAWALAKMPTEERWKVICPHLHDSRWREVILLTAGQIGVVDANEQEATTFVQQILNTESHSNELLHRDELLAAACLADEIEVSAELAQKVVARVGRLLRSPFRKVAEAAGGVLGNLEETDLALLAAEEAADGLSGEKSWMRRVAMATVAHLDSGSPEVAMAVMSAIADPDSELRSAALEGMCRWEPASDEIIATVIEILEKERDTWLDLRLGPTLIQWKPGDLTVRSIVEEMLVDAYFSHYRIRRPLSRYISGSWLETEDDWEALGKILQRLMGSDNRYIRRMVIEMLADLEREGRMVNAVWAQALRDPDRRVREAALKRLLDLEQVPEELAAGVTKMRQCEELPYLRQMANGLALKLGQLVVDEPELVDLLASEEWQVRQVAAEVLGRLERVGPETLGALVQAMTDSDSDVQKAAREALGSLAKRDAGVVPQLRQALTEDDELRTNALLVLAALQQGEADEAALVELLEHRDWSVRQAAAEVLGQFERVGPETPGALMQALVDSNPEVRQAAREALGSLAKQNAGVVPQLRQALTEDDEEVRANALLVLVALEQGEADEVALVELLQHRDWRIRQAAVEVLGRLERVELRPFVALVLTLADSEPPVRKAAREALGGLAERDAGVVTQLRHALTEGDEEVRVNTLLVLALEQGEVDEATLVELLQHRDWRVREVAAEVLGRLERMGPETVGALVQALLADDYYEVWLAAQEALGNLAERDAGVVTQLRQALTEDDEEVRISAIVALAALQQGEADEAALVELLEHRDWSVRQAAAEVLGRFERVGPETVGALMQALADSDSDVRKAVREALGSLAKQDTGVVTQLRQALTEGDEEVRANALLVLAALQQGEADEAVL